MSTPPTAPLWPDPVRAAAFAAWLAPTAQAHGLLSASVRIASADASFRRYLRIDTATGATRIIMDAPPAHENCAPFVRVAQLMLDAGLNAPRVLAWDEPNGFMLLTDLGAHTMMDALAAAHPAAALPLFDAAIAALVRWQQASRPHVLPPYDEALLRRELALFPDWYLTQHRGLALDAEMRQTLDEAFSLIVRHNLDSPSVYVHRDFMPRNLMLPASGETTLGILDFQDAVYGPITYDIASLLRDAFISWDADFVTEVTRRYWHAARAGGLPVGADFESFCQAVDWMALQRHLKVAGIFARLTLRDGKPKYLADAPRFIAYIRATAAPHPELAPLLRLIDRAENVGGREIRN